MKLALRLALLLVAAALAAGCSPPGPAFTVPGGDEVRLRIDSTGRYLLRRPLTVPRGMSLYLQYRGNGGVAVPLPAPARSGAAAPARPPPSALPPAGDGTLKVQLPVAAGTRLAGLWVNSSGTVAVEGAGLEPTFRGMRREGVLTELGRGVSYLTVQGAETQLGLREELYPEGQVSWELALHLHLYTPFSRQGFRTSGAAAEGPPALPEQPATVFLTVSAGSRQMRLSVRRLAGDTTVHLPAGLLGFRPQALTVQPAPDQRARLSSAELLPVPANRWSPLAADPGAVLAYDRSLWRRPDFELFAWSRYPQVLILDTADYRVQARLFKRLAFFVEKAGFRGRLLEDRELDDRHGYNAHDYHAEDLARFYQKAADQRFPLNAEEEMLRELLLANGVLRRQGERIAPGAGAVLSVSRSSSPELRRLLLTHEVFHGLFFAEPAYREACMRAWERLDEPTRAYLLLMFRWVGYDLTDPYLMANELQAYLFQQDRRGVEYYFGTLMASRLARSFPGERPALERFIAADPHRFRRLYDSLEADLRETAGMVGGHAAELDILDKTSHN